jgi:hypothetical protein
MVRGNKCIFSHGLIAATLLAVSFAARAEMTYTITSYPTGQADLPCDAFKKNPDGSWTQVAILIAGGALTVGLAPLIVPPLEGVLAGVMLVVFRALVRHVSEYAPSASLSAWEKSLGCSARLRFVAAQAASPKTLVLN